jgi:enhancing lycopene biosynthesis protein 2
MKKFALILSGCGVYDGAEIHETVATMIALRKNGAEYQCFAPNRLQYHVINHLTGSEVGEEERNILEESARLARGKIKEITEYNPKDFDGLIFPGGFGIVKNVSNYAIKGADCELFPDVIKAIQDTIDAKKPIGAECITPAMMAAYLKGATVTIGNDKETVHNIQKMGGHHVETKHDGVVYDPKYNLYTTPCYMLGTDILEIYESAEALVKALVKA